MFCGSSSFGRAIAFQAIGGEFEPRLPLWLSHISQMSQMSFKTYLFDIYDTLTSMTQKKPL